MITCPYFIVSNSYITKKIHHVIIIFNPKQIAQLEEELKSAMEDARLVRAELEQVREQADKMEQEFESLLLSSSAQVKGVKRMKIRVEKT